MLPFSNAWQCGIPVFHARLCIYVNAIAGVNNLEMFEFFFYRHAYSDISRRQALQRCWKTCEISLPTTWYWCFAFLRLFPLRLSLHLTLFLIRVALSDSHHADFVSAFLSDHGRLVNADLLKALVACVNESSSPETVGSSMKTV